MSKGNSLPAALKTLINAPTFSVGAAASASASRVTRGRAAGPSPAPKAAVLKDVFARLDSEAAQKGFGWGEWLSIAVGALIAIHRSSKRSPVMTRI